MWKKNCAWTYGGQALFQKQGNGIQFWKVQTNRPEKIIWGTWTGKVIYRIVMSKECRRSSLYTDLLAGISFVKFEGISFFQFAYR